jgi:hypothetical protein
MAKYLQVKQNTEKQDPMQTLRKAFYSAAPARSAILGTCDLEEED